MHVRCRVSLGLDDHGRHAHVCKGFGHRVGLGLGLRLGLRLQLRGSCLRLEVFPHLVIAGLICTGLKHGVRMAAAWGA